MWISRAFSRDSELDAVDIKNWKLSLLNNPASLAFRSAKKSPPALDASTATRINYAPDISGNNSLS